MIKPRVGASALLKCIAGRFPSRRLFTSRSETAQTTGNPEEMAHFAELAQSWWDPSGPQRILHKMNLMRMDFIREVLASNGPEAPGYALSLLPPEVRAAKMGLPKHMKALDIGCGGGLLSESLARQSFITSVTGIDVTPEVLQVARDHQSTDPALSNLSYELSTIESLSSREKFDLVTMFEVLEHLDDPAATLQSAMSHVKPGGWLFLSTINRTAMAAFSTIFMGEYIFSIVPRGTHTFSKYIKEHELREHIESQPGWTVAASEGCIFIPTQNWVRFSNRSTDVGPSLLNRVVGTGGGNYLLAAQRHHSKEVKTPKESKKDKKNKHRTDERD